MFLCQRVSLILFFQFQYYVLRSEIGKKISGNGPTTKFDSGPVYEVVVNQTGWLFSLNQIVQFLFTFIRLYVCYEVIINAFTRIVLFIKKKLFFLTRQNRTAYDNYNCMENTLYGCKSEPNDPLVLTDTCI